MKIYIVYRLNGGEVREITTEQPDPSSYGDLFNAAELTEDRCPDGISRSPVKVFDNGVMRNATAEDDLEARRAEDYRQHRRRVAKYELEQDHRFIALQEAVADSLAELAPKSKKEDFTREAFAKRVAACLDD